MLGTNDIDKSIKLYECNIIDLPIFDQNKNSLREIVI